MNAIKLAALTAVIAEAALYGLATLWTQMNSGSSNPIGIAAMVFHIPGVLIADQIFHNTGPAAIIFIIFSGIVQFFLIAWVAITLWRKRGKI